MKVAVLEMGVMQFTVNKEDIPWRNVEGIGYQWYRSSDKSWQPLEIDDAQLRKVAFKTHENSSKKTS